MFISGQVSAQKRTIGMEIIKKQMQMNHEYLFYTLVGIIKIQRQTIYTRYGINKKIIIIFVPKRV